MVNFINVEKLLPEVRECLLLYMEEMLKVHNDKILSIFVYGSACGGDYIKGISDINSAVVFKQMDFAQLKASLKRIRVGIKNKITAPLFLTPEYIKSSCDTFPIEFLEMKENHILIYGEDFLKNLQIDPVNIRYICEEQLKGKLIRMRQAYLENGLNEKAIKALMIESLNSLMPIFRGLLRLRGITPPLFKEEVIGLVGDYFNVGKDTFIAILKDKKNIEKIHRRKLETLFVDYLEQIKNLAEAADKL